MIGKSVNQYQVLGTLGQGGMGVVYKAHDTQVDRLVALKFLPSHVQLTDEAIERFEREAQAAALVDHPNICAFYELGQTAENDRFMAMAYIEGEALTARIAQGTMPLDEALMD